SAKDVGKGGDVPLLIQVVEGFNNLTSLTVAVQTDDNAAFSSPTEFAGKKVVSFLGIPIRRADAILNTESAVTN
ncbi:phage major capsid protein, partial [Cronobacter sakazakii]|uniref:phage major capsid protein n=1 Tax=Cronobacter sakazakii TaxID=28141 RepID=UPI00387B5497